jgi:dimethylglycine dehydrogenase
VPWHHQAGLYQLLTEAGKDLGLRPFGMRAMMSLRLDKSFGSWMREFKPDYTPLETGLDRFVDYSKAVDFVGKAAVLAEREQGVDRKLCTFELAARDADAVAWEPIWHNNEVVGYVTSGGYSHHAQKSVAFGFVPVELATEGREVQIEILGEMIPARLYTAPLFDPTNEYLRG